MDKIYTKTVIDSDMIRKTSTTILVNLPNLIKKQFQKIIALLLLITLTNLNPQEAKSQGNDLIDLSETIAGNATEGYVITGTMLPYSVQFGGLPGGAVTTAAGPFRVLTFTPNADGKTFRIIQSGIRSTTSAGYNPNEPKHLTAIFNKIVIGPNLNITFEIEDIDLTGDIEIASTSQLTVLLDNTGTIAQYIHGTIRVPLGASMTLNSANAPNTSDGALNVIAAAGSSNAAIGGFVGEDAGTITISGGTITATGGSGIGYGGGGGAGIGGGAGGFGGTIAINGGTITATGGAGTTGTGYAISAGGGGAGIGGGGGDSSAAGGNGGEITIAVGATVELAKGGTGGNGSGSGSGASNAPYPGDISGGGGAGIGGGGAGGNGTTTAVNGGVGSLTGITITGTVKNAEGAKGGADTSLFAYSGAGGAGIGGGGAGGCGGGGNAGTITITGTVGFYSGSVLSGGAVGGMYSDGYDTGRRGGGGAGIGGGGGTSSYNGGNGGNITIDGGTVYARSVSAYGGAGIGGGQPRGVGTADNGKIEIKNGSLVVASGNGGGGAGIGGGASGAGTGTDGSIIISGSTVTAGDTLGGAGIGGGNNAAGTGSGGKIDIISGTVTASGSGGNGGAGIGGGSNGAGTGQNGSIIIRGGIINASGNAGIGGGGGTSSGAGTGTGGKIEITGGTVTATAAGYNGAGIGGGGGLTGNNVHGGAGTGQNGSIIISGIGTIVNATGSATGAGIGGGGSVNRTGTGTSGNGGAGTGQNGSITINDGTVTATAGNNGSAGIGGGGTGTTVNGNAGNGGNGGNITINGGTVKAFGTASSAGIGGGAGGVASGTGNSGIGGNGGVVNINGGNVTATGGPTGGAGIGAAGRTQTLTGTGATFTLKSEANLKAYSQGFLPAINASSISSLTTGFFTNNRFNIIPKTTAAQIFVFADGYTGDNIADTITSLLLPGNYRSYAYSTGATARTDNNYIDLGYNPSFGGQDIRTIYRIFDLIKDIYSINNITGFLSHTTETDKSVLPVQLGIPPEPGIPSAINIEKYVADLVSTDHTLSPTFSTFQEGGFLYSPTLNTSGRPNDPVKVIWNSNILPPSPHSETTGNVLIPNTKYYLVTYTSVKVEILLSNINTIYTFQSPVVADFITKPSITNCWATASDNNDEVKISSTFEGGEAPLKAFIYWSTNTIDPTDKNEWPDDFIELNFNTGEFDYEGFNNFVINNLTPNIQYYFMVVNENVTGYDYCLTQYMIGTQACTVQLTSGTDTDDQIVCTGQNITDIIYSTTGVVDETEVDITGLPTGIDWIWENDEIIISGAPSTASGSPFTYTITFTGECSSEIITGTITVNAIKTPTFNFGNTLEYCLDETNTEILESITTNEITGHWERPLGTTVTTIQTTTPTTTPDVYTFIPDAGQCTTTTNTTLSVTITAKVDLTYHANSASGTPPIGLSYCIGSNANIAYPLSLVKSCSTFYGWAYSPSSVIPDFLWNEITGIFTPSFFLINENTDLYAVWGPNLCANALVGSMIVLQEPTCDNNDGIIQLLLNGSGNYEYYINGIYIDVLPPNGIITNTGAGFYQIEVYDLDKDCSDISSILRLNNSDAIGLLEIISITDAADCNSSGAITFEVTGIVAPYEYQIDDQTPITINHNLPVTVNDITAGEHTLTIINDENCPITGKMFTIRSLSDEITFDLDVTNASTCGDKGELKITVTDGIPTEYRINNGFWLTWIGVEQFLSLSDGYYEVEMRDETGCVTKIKSATIANEDNDAFTVTLGTITTPNNCLHNNGSIEITLNGPTGNYYYSLDANSTLIPFTTTNNSYTYFINTLVSGVYNIIFTNDYHDCMYNLYNVEVPQGLDYGIVAAPSALSPQTFCNGSTVSNLQADGINLKWYLGTDFQPANTPLINGIYYVTQTTSDGCESEQTAVTVIISNEVIIDAPDIPFEVHLCAPATLADVPTNGNTNIVWYDQMIGGNKISNPENVDLDNGDTFYAAIEYGNGNCRSIQRTEVNIIISTSGNIPPPQIESPQHFCEGALISNMKTSTNKIVWYWGANSNEPITPDTKLQNHTYFAAQKAGNCQSTVRTPVQVIIDQYPAPFTLPKQTMCNGKIVYLSELMIIGSHIKWFTQSSGNNEIPASTPVVNGTTYYAAQTTGNCEGQRTPIEIVNDCYSPYGTVFPFVKTGDAEFDQQFLITAKLYLLPPANVFDKIGYIRAQKPVHTVVVEYYDCTGPSIVGAPKNPGIQGYTNNPGLLINWIDKGITNPGFPNNKILNETDKCPLAPIGQFKFTDIAPDTYIIEIARKGFLPRYGKITISNNGYIGHRELLGGDLNGDLVINEKDLSAFATKKSSYNQPANYNWLYDLNGDKAIDGNDQYIINVNLGAQSTIYAETIDWFNNP